MTSRDPVHPLGSLQRDNPPPTAGRPRWFESGTAHSIGWQALGSAATVGAALWISWQFGLAAQGEFGLAKSWFDAAAAWACLGVPQGLLHMQYHAKVPPTALKPWIRRYVTAVGATALLLAGLLWFGGWRLAAWAALSVPFAVTHLIARSLILPQRGAACFGAATAVPALCVLAGVAVLVALNHAMDFDALLLAATILAALITATMAWPRGQQAVPFGWSTATLWQASLQSWLQQALAAALSAALLSTVVVGGHGALALGEASLALQFYQVFVVLATYASPLVYDRVARSSDRGALVSSWNTRWMWGALVGGVVTIPLACWAWQSDARGAAALLAAGLMVPAGCAAVAARLAATILLARGRYTELSVQALCRLLLGVGLLWFVSRILPAAAAVAVTLLVLEPLTWWRCQRVIAS